MTPVAGVVLRIVTEKAPEVTLMEHSDPTQELPAAAGDPALRHRICQGLRYVVRFGFMPKKRSVETTFSVKIES